MAYENINTLFPNFCRGPQSGTICTLDTSSTTTVLKIKNTSGGLIMDLTLSSNIITTNPRIEYIGPTNLSSVTDDLIFFTFEKVSTSVCMIRRWATRIAFRELLLKEQAVKSNTGDEYYNCNDFAVEYYHRTFTQPNEYYSYLNMSSTDYVKTGTKLFLGPSTDADNLGATEVVTVSHVAEYMGSMRVYLTAPITHQYVDGDSIFFYTNVYLYSEIGYGGDTNKGTLFKVDAYSWVTKEADVSSIYKKVTASRWCPMIQGVASVIGTNMLFVRPYDSYQIWKSQFLRNVESDKNTIYPVYDLMFSDYSIYKLQKKTTLKNDSGVYTTYSWSNYNYQTDTLLPYTSSMSIWAEKNILTGQYKNIDIQASVRDQFHVGLRDVDINFYTSGDTGVLLDPLNGLVTTDIDGNASINYRSGASYNGQTIVSAKAAGSSSSTGSQYVWAYNSVWSWPQSESFTVGAKQKASVSSALPSFKQINYEYKIFNKTTELYEYPNMVVRGKSFFTSPGGDWGTAGTTGFCTASVVATWLPRYYKGAAQYDAPKLVNSNPFTNWPYPLNPGSGSFFVGNQIKLVGEVSGYLTSRALNYFLLYSNTQPGAEYGFVPRINIKCPSETGSRSFSQLNLSLHTYWADGLPYNYVWTHTEIDQFIFVEDAIPRFYSEKNPPETNIWLRLRPFAFSLDRYAFKMLVREISYYGDTGFYDVTNDVTLTSFDAGSGNLGLEILYDPPQNFYHNSLVFVRIEVYDIAPSPNFIWVEYWFQVVPDYKSPYVTNMIPGIESIDIPITTQISFSVFDDGTGVDIDSLECLLNSRRMHPSNIVIEEISRYHYNVVYTPPENLYYNKDYKVTIKVSDLTPIKNTLNYSYRFYTEESPGVIITNEYPQMCKAGMDRFQTVRATILANGAGVDIDSVRMQVYDKDVNPNKIPIIYRVG